MPGLPILDTLLPQQIFAFLLIFARLGALLMVFPGIGEGFVSTRFRLGLALAVSFLLMGPLAGRLPALPADGGALFLLIATESLVGLAVGLSARLLLTSLNVAGNVIALQTGLGFAVAVDPTQGAQGAILSTFLVTMGILMIFITGTHAILFDGIFRSYDLFPPGDLPPVAGFLELVVRFVSASFLLGIEMSAPFLVLSLVFYAGLGVVSKMMPQFQVFFISMPLSIMGGFGLLMLLIGLMMQIFLDRFADSFSGLVR
ncbi:MAG: flagellar type III secretion system protein FliR [Alphaproteobacteria bacterium]|nr:flagellar type III secretion system protein FliR [Alphaproteobacteria bacterium]